MDTGDEETEGGNSTLFFIPPTPVLSDYVQIAYLILIFSAGAPLNLYTFYKLSRQYYITKSRILLLSVHLNLSDLMILFFFASAKICWLLTYRWMGGDVMCKLIKFAQTVSFSLSSNIVVCIGLDRLFSLLRPVQVKATASQRCRRMLVVAWLLALICSAPQLQVWTIFYLTPQWAQCLDIWKVWNLHNETTETTAMIQIAYNSTHLVIVFWLPLAIVLISYTVILKNVYKSLGNDNHVQIVERRSLDGGMGSGGHNNDSSPPSLNNSQRNNNESATRISAQMPLNTKPLHVQLNLRPSTTSSCQQPLLRRHACHLRIKRTKYRTLKVTILIVAAYVVCWLPYNILAVWALIDHTSYAIFENYVYFFYGLIAVNTVVNPLIYSRLSVIWCGLRKKRKRSLKQCVRFDVPN